MRLGFRVAVAIAPIRPLAQKPPYAAAVALNRQKTKKKKKKKKRKNHIALFHVNHYGIPGDKFIWPLRFSLEWQR